MTMQKMNILLGALAFSCALTVNAQGRHQREGGQGGFSADQRQEMVQRQADQLVERMSLDDITAAWFVPLFKEYSEALMAVRKESMPTKDKSIDGLSDEDAEQVILDFIAGEEKQAALKRDYYARFKERLTPQQLIKVFLVQPGQRGGNGQRGGGQRGGQGQGGFGGPGYPPPGGFGPGGGFGGPF